MGIDNARSVVQLLILIRDLRYNKSDRNQLIMATVKIDFDLYLCVQRGKTTGKYYKIFAFTVDTITANGHNA